MRKRILTIILILICFFVVYANMKTVNINKIQSVETTKKSVEASATATTTAASTSSWDTNKVNIVYDTAGVAVPVPKGYVASGADGEHTVSTGFVIYEGEDEVTNDNAWEESKSRNQWVWIPVADTSRVYLSETYGIQYYYWDTYR